MASSQSALATWLDSVLTRSCNGKSPQEGHICDPSSWEVESWEDGSVVKVTAVNPPTTEDRS